MARNYAEALAANVDETSSSIQQMGVVLAQTAQNGETLLGAVEEVTGTLTDMINTVGSIATRVHKVDEVSKHSASEARQGGERLAESIAAIGERSQEIGKIIKVIPISFQTFVRRIELRDRIARVPFEQAAAFGFLPLPKLLLSVVGDREVSDGITVHSESLSVTIRLDRFLPSFVDLTIDRIDLVAGGLRVVCGGGGADVPPEMNT